MLYIVYAYIYLSELTCIHVCASYTTCILEVTLIILMSFTDMYVHRILRQIFQCLGRIIDVLILLFFFVTIFAVSGNYVLICVLIIQYCIV